MESDLLLKEDEFYKENEQLELKTKQLMQKVNNVMKIQDNLIKDTLKTQAEISEVKKNGKSLLSNKEIEHFLDKDQSVLIDEASNFGSGVIKVYKAKIKGLLAEKERLHQDLKQKSEESKKQQKENQSLKEEKEKWFMLYSTCKNNTGKLEGQISNLNARLQSKDAENSCLKKEVEHLKKDLKTTTLNLNNTEVRLSRATEEAEKHKAALKQSRDEEKEFKDGYRKQINELAAAVKQLEKQKLELLNGFKKQKQLIDVLKKQKVHLEALKVGEMMEAEYLKILEWKFN